MSGVGDEREQPWFWIKLSATATMRTELREDDPKLYTVLAVYAALVELANAEEARCDLSAAESATFTTERRRIAAYSGTSTKTVDRVTETLERVGLLRVERTRVEGNRNLPNRYVLVDRRMEGDSKSPTPDSGSPSLGDSESPKSLKKEGKKKGTLGNEVEGVFNFWVDTLGKRKGTKLGPKRRRNVEARLREGFSPRELCEAIVGVTLSPHHMGDNDRGPNGTGKPFNDLELICREPEKVEDFRDLYRQANRKRTAETNAGEKTNERRRRIEAEQEGQ